MRLPYLPNPPPTATDEEAAIVARIAARRAPRPLQPLDLALLHSPLVADGWNAFLGAVRTQTRRVPADLRELAICRVGAVNRAWYEWGHHAPLAVGAGVSERAVGVLRAWTGPVSLGENKTEVGGKEGGTGEGKEGAALTEEQWAVVVLADEMTRNVEVSDETFAKVRGILGDQGTVELVVTVAAYNSVSRFLVALDGESFFLFLLSFLSPFRWHWISLSPYYLSFFSWGNPARVVESRGFVCWRFCSWRSITEEKKERKKADIDLANETYNSSRREKWHRPGWWALKRNRTNALGRVIQLRRRPEKRLHSGNERERVCVCECEGVLSMLAIRTRSVKGEGLRGRWRLGARVVSCRVVSATILDEERQ